MKDRLQHTRWLSLIKAWSNSYLLLVLVIVALFSSIGARADEPDFTCFKKLMTVSSQQQLTALTKECGLYQGIDGSYHLPVDSYPPLNNYLPIDANSSSELNGQKPLMTFSADKPFDISRYEVFESKKVSNGVPNFFWFAAKPRTVLLTGESALVPVQIADLPDILIANRKRMGKPELNLVLELPYSFNFPKIIPKELLKQANFWLEGVTGVKNREAVADTVVKSQYKIIPYGNAGTAYLFLSKNSAKKSVYISSANIGKVDRSPNSFLPYAFQVTRFYVDINEGMGDVTINDRNGNGPDEIIVTDPRGLVKKRLLRNRHGSFDNAFVETKISDGGDSKGTDKDTSAGKP